MGKVTRVFEIYFAKYGGNKAPGRPRRRRENIKADLQDLKGRNMTASITTTS